MSFIPGNRFCSQKEKIKISCKKCHDFNLTRTFRCPPVSFSTVTVNYNFSVISSSRVVEVDGEGKRYYKVLTFFIFFFLFFPVILTHECYPVDDKT